MSEWFIIVVHDRGQMWGVPYTSVKDSKEGASLVGTMQKVDFDQGWVFMTFGAGFCSKRPPTTTEGEVFTSAGENYTFSAESDVKSFVGINWHYSLFLFHL